MSIFLKDFNIASPDLNFIKNKTEQTILDELSEDFVLKILLANNIKQSLLKHAQVIFPLNIFIICDLIVEHKASILKEIEPNQVDLESLELKTEQEKSTEALKLKSEKYQDTLQKHITNNFTPICLSVHDVTKPAYIPKTIVDFKNLKIVLNTDKKQQSLLKKLNYVANLSDQARGEYFLSLAEARIITQKDCKQYNCSEMLIGQKGVFAKQDIPEYTVINYYSGVYFMNPQEKKMFVEEYGSHQSIYGFSLPNEKDISMTGYLFGNDISLINAGTTYSGDAYKIANEIVKKCNTIAVYAKSLEFPNQEFVNDPKKFDLVCFVTRRTIKKGEELLVNYGMEYWRKRIDNFTQSTQKEIDDHVINLRNRVKRNNKMSKIKMK
jgi:hypothetical protein